MEGKTLLVVGEYHGNPGSITLFDGEGECLLSLPINAAFPSGFKYTKLKEVKPVIEGTSKLTSAIASAFSLEYGGNTPNLRSIQVDDDKIDFLDSNKLIFRMHVKSSRSNVGKGNLS